ncbi:MAG: DUF2254 domain-containing protein [Fimbriimonadaceae bacterium]
MPQPTPRWQSAVLGSMWVLPVLFVVAAALASEWIFGLDRHLRITEEQSGLFFTDPDSARALLSTITASLIAFVGTVFSITMVVLQLAGSQYSPRVLREFLRDVRSKLALGFFMATFTFAILTLQKIPGAELGPNDVLPVVSIWTALALMLGSLVVFVIYLGGMAGAIRIENLLHWIVNETRDSLAQMYPEGIGGEGDPAFRPSGTSTHVSLERAGVITAIHGPTLLRLAQREDVVIELLIHVGDYAPAGYPVARIWRSQRDLGREVGDAVATGIFRTTEQDPLAGFRYLVDIASKALSPAVNDPTTSVQAVDNLHDLLRRVALRAWPSPVRTDAGGTPRLILPRPGWEDYVRLAVTEVRLFGAHSVSVNRRLLAMLDDLLRAAPADLWPCLERERRLLLEANEAFGDRDDERLARTPSLQSNGPASL